jgi:hypothetical protein
MLALFGAGHVAERILKNGIRPDLILDNNPELNGQNFANVKICSPSEHNLKPINRIIICTTSFLEVENQILALGYSGIIELAKPLEEQRTIKQLHEFKFNGFISSGLPSINKGAGGGIYRILETDDSCEVSKIFSGNTHGLIMYEQQLAFTCQGIGIIFTDIYGQETHHINLPEKLRPHGLFISKESIFVACSLADCILQLNFDGKIIEKYKLSNKYDLSGSPQHHCNDIHIANNCIYVSMFSISGNWKKGVFDGGILEIDLETKEKRILCSTLRMPHSVTIHDGQLHVLNSYDGELLGYNFEPIGSLSGFARGLQFKNNFAIIGESRNRNFSLLSGKKTFASLDSRVTIADTRSKVSRSITLKDEISEIHGIVAV